ncbi:MAG: ABC transporter ATP-binding protein [Deltaproteobacteria bacterium]|jgi:oligopeptide/dipeptide ABC transporter ATP-binding protein|nr:ABC transporter ATP-binding protein [Deltaproteobacteria bacterium]
MLNLAQIHKTFHPSSSLSQELMSFWRRKSRNTGVFAVRGLDLEVREGEILGLVGESGSGKSTLGRIMGGLYQPDSGQVLFEGKDITTFDRKEKQLFNFRVQLMFQDPSSSLNPRLNARAALSEGLIVHRMGSRADRRRKVDQLFHEVGLTPDLADRYPHQFSGGQRQRLCLARALSLDPDLLIADEPASALDVSIQAQIINLLLSLKEKRGLTMVLISHDLSLVCLMADRVAVMYGGLIMEEFPRDQLSRSDHHPYVKALWASAEYASTNDLILEGEPPDPQNPPSGCPFHPRCPEAQDICSLKAPMTKPFGLDCRCACHFRG